MNKRAVPMIHVPDVLATVEWYKRIGFNVDNTYGNESGGLSFAILSFGATQVMFNQGGSVSASERREVDLYLYTEGVDQKFEELKDVVDVIEAPHDTFYGMREFIFRDLNRFWITLGQESVFARLMTVVAENNVNAVRNIVDDAKLRPESLTAALSIANSPEMESVLKNAGAIPPASIADEVLKTYVGRYRKDDFEIIVHFEDGDLFAGLRMQEPLRLVALNETSFTPTYLDELGKIIFRIQANKIAGCTIQQGSHAILLQRVD